MKSGLEDRNNSMERSRPGSMAYVSMKSGLEDRNNSSVCGSRMICVSMVSMKSGLEDRNNR